MLALGLHHTNMSGLATGWAFGAIARPTAEGCLALSAWALRSCLALCAWALQSSLGLWAWSITQCLPVWTWTVKHCLPIWAWNTRVWAWTYADPCRAVLLATFCAGIVVLEKFVDRLVRSLLRSLLRGLFRWRMRSGRGVALLGGCCRDVVLGNMPVAALGGMTVGAWIFPDVAWLLYLGGSNFLASAMGGCWVANSRPVTADALFSVLWGCMPTATIECCSMLWAGACANPLGAMLRGGVFMLVWSVFRGLYRRKIGLRSGVDMWAVCCFVAVMGHVTVDGWVLVNWTLLLTLMGGSFFPALRSRCLLLRRPRRAKRG